MTATLLTITFWEFLRFYLLLIALFIPFSIIFIVMLNKRTNIIKKIDAFLDRKLYGEMPAASQPAPERKDPEVSDKETAEADKKQSSENAEQKESKSLLEQKERDEDIGVAWFQIKVNDNYRCRINRQTAEQFNNTLGQWSCENGFVGEILNDKFFHARKVGRTYVLFGNESESHAYIYNIEVLPSNEDWPYQAALEDVFRKRNINDVKSRRIEDQLTRADFKNNLTVYKGANKGEEVIYEHGVKDTVLRVLFKFPVQDDKTIEDIVANLGERMQEIENINSSSIRVWIHEDENGYVDFISYLRKASNGKLLFGIGKNWRVNGEETEIALNLSMIEKSFLKCLEDEGLEDDSLTLEVESRKVRAPKSQSSNPGDETKPKRPRKQATSRKKHQPDAEEKAETSVEEIPDSSGDAETEEIPVETSTAEVTEDEDYTPDDDQNYDE